MKSRILIIIGVLIGIIVILGATLAIVLAQNQTMSEELHLDRKLQTAELIDTFKDKYSNYEITEYPDSNGITYKYVASGQNREIELLLEKDRIVLKAWNEDGLWCIGSNPIPRDLLNNCPLKW